MPPIRVLHLARVINRYDSIDTVVRYLPREHFSMEVATFEPKSNIQSPDYERAGIPHHVIPVPSIRSYPAYLKAALRLARLLKDRNIHILHTHHYWEGLVGALTKQLYPSVKLIIHRRYAEDIIVLGGWKACILLTLERLSYKQADVIIVSSPNVRNLVRNLHKKIASSKLLDIPLGFDFEADKYRPLPQHERLAFRQAQRIDENACVITNVGSHRILKGQIELIEAFTQLVKDGVNAVLWLVGDGPDGAYLRKIAKPLGDKVYFWGWQSPDMVRLLMGASDIIAHPSYSESFSQVMVEALALERALVISRVPGPIETITHAETGWLIPPKNVEKLYEALKILIANPQLRERMGIAGRKHVLSKLHYKLINPTYIDLYTKLCSPSA